MNGSSNSRDELQAIAATSDGGFIAAGDSAGDDIPGLTNINGMEYYVVKYK